MCVLVFDEVYLLGITAGELLTLPITHDYDMKLLKKNLSAHWGFEMPKKGEPFPTIEELLHKAS